MISTRPPTTRIRRARAVRAEIQRTAGGEEIAVAELRIVPKAWKASLAGHELALTPSEFRLLVSLARAKGRAQSRDHLWAELRHREYGAFDRSLDVLVSCLRKKLGDDPKHPRFIRTVRYSGYMLADAGAQ